MVLLGDFCDRYLSDLLRYLWFVVDCVAAFVLKFLLCILFSVWIWIHRLISEVIHVIVLLCCPFFCWYAGYDGNEQIHKCLCT